MSSFCKAKYKSSNHEAARYMCRRLFTCAKCSTTGEVDAVCQSTQSGNMNSGYNSWPDYPILGDDFRARCNSLYLQPLGPTAPNLRSTDYQVCHHFCLLKVFHWCPVSYSMPGECKACRGTQGEHTKQDMRQWIQQLRIWEVPFERSFTPRIW